VTPEPMTFSCQPTVQFVGDGRSIRLCEPLIYRDRTGQQWYAPEGAVANGASVPRVFWRIMPPLTGKYRRASIIHDWYCETRSRPSAEVHKVWCEMLVADEVIWWKRWPMCHMVRWLGPRW